MHERSLARALLEELDRIRHSEGADIVRATIEVGPLSGVEPSQLIDAFYDLAPTCALEHVELELRTVDLTAHCPACSRTFAVQNFVFRCPHCGGAAHAVSGSTVLLASVDIKTPILSAQH